MNLLPDQVRRFYRIWMPLLTYVNQERNLLPNLQKWDDSRPLAAQEAATLRNALWEDDKFLDIFAAENPANLGRDDLALVATWKYRVAGKFFVFKHLKKYSVFLGDAKVYGVLGLHGPIEEIVAFTPCYVEAVLLPFEGKIIYDSLLAGHNITFGRGIRRSLNETYRKAKMQGEIITSLLPAKVEVARQR
jgi:hypothetical protein